MVGLEIRHSALPITLSLHCHYARRMATARNPEVQPLLALARTEHLAKLLAHELDGVSKRFLG